VSTGAGYEERDVSFRPVVVAAFVLFGLIVGTFLLMWALNRGLVTREAEESPPASPLAAAYGRQEPPAPRLQDHPLRDLAELRARDQKLLDTYGWVDRDEGQVRVPVARAMELLLGEGKR